MIVKPVRHVEHVADLTEAESVELGPLLRQVSATITEVISPEQVYVCLWSHAEARPCHIHFVVQPASKADMDRFGAYGPALQMAMFSEGTLPDEAAVVEICERFRQVLSH
ncbi:hypothetical protein ACFSKW_27025 [Nonomuraea mangrovi]|uniref:HIT domain-containing protein n=1 Tax=Nonomuraea mangrovi TaxID=2316207 RepID=A0ABW4SZS5_9ACTN